MTNLAGEKKYARIRARLFKALEGWMRDQNDPGVEADTERNKPANQRERKVIGQ